MRKYFRFWYLFLVGAGLSTLTANLYLRYYAVPQYSISSSILIKESGGAPDMMLPGGNSEKNNGMTNINDEIQILKSRSLMERTLNELSLSTRYQVEKTFKNEEIYGNELPIKIIVSKIDSSQHEMPFGIKIKSSNKFELIETTGRVSMCRLGQKILSSNGSFTVVKNPNFSNKVDQLSKSLTITFHSTQKLAEHYNRILTVLPVNKDANVLTLSFTDPIPQRGVDIMNKLLEVYNKEGLEEKSLLASNTLSFISDRIKNITATLTGVERNVEQYKRTHQVSDVNKQTANYIEQTSDYSKKISEWSVQIDILESIENYLIENAGQHKIVPSTLGLQDKTLLDLISRYNDIQLQRERMLQTAQAENPLVQNMTTQLITLKSNILENLRNIKDGLLITSKSLKNNSGQFQDQLTKMPSIERELLQINRQQTTKQNVYLYLLQKREETALTLAATVSKTKIIDPAKSSNSPVSPNSKLMYALAILFGFGLPFTLIYVKSTTNDKVQSKQDVTQVTATPILGEISHSYEKHKTVIVTRGNFSPIVEMFGLIRAHLNTATLNKSDKVILVTSSISGEGKSFFSINLGASLALTGKKVIILELDFRAPNLLREVGMEEGVGIADYLLSNELSIADIISPVEKVVNLYIAGAGVIPLNPTELMSSSKLSYLINELKLSFDHIIIDTAPVGLVADAFSVSGLADATIYLMRFNYTMKTHVELVDNIYTNKTLPNPLIVLNDATWQNGNSYIYGYS